MNLLIINGYSASGKSTLSLKFAKKHDYALIIQDHFLFKMNPSSLKTKKPNSFNHEITQINLLSCIENYMKYKRDILIEGALVSITNTDPIDISDFVNLAKKYEYTTTIISLVANEKVRKQRQKKRGNTLPKRTDKKLVDAAEKQYSKFNNHRIDTTKSSITKSLEEIEKIVINNDEVK